MQKARRTGGNPLVSASTPLAERLRSLRISAGLTLEGLAERSGVSARTISDIERGVSAAPQRRTVEELARGLALDDTARDGFLRTARVRRRTADDAGRASAVAPHRVDDFTGREREIAEILFALGGTDGAAVSVPTVVISGSPGLGKTTSALEALGRARGSRPTLLFVDLDGLSAAPLSPLDVLRALLGQLPGLGAKLPATLDEAVRLWRAATVDDPPAVLLDNAASEAQIRPVLAMDPNGIVVVTSRRSLAGLEGVRRVVLGPLEPEDCVLLLERLVPIGQREPHDLARLAALCDRVPLALRIAGNRIASRPSWTAADFVKRMREADNRLRLLVAGDLAVETAFALSYDDLDAHTALLFCSLSVIDGGSFDARIAAAALGADVLDTETRLDELTDLGLLEARGGTRYRLHDLLSLYAAARFAAEHGQAAVEGHRGRLRRWLLGSLERAGAWFEPDRTPDEGTTAGMSFPDSSTASEWIRREEPHWWPAMRAARAAGEHELVVDVADSLHWFSELWIDWGNWTGFFTLAVESSRALRDSRLEAMHLGYLVWSVILESGDFETALATAHDALAAARLSGDHEQTGWANFYIAWALQDLGRPGESVAFATAALEEFEEADLEDGAMESMIMLSRAFARVGDHERAVEDLRAIVRRARDDGAQARGLATQIALLTADQYLAMNLVALGRVDEALDAAESAIATARSLDSASRLASALRERALVYVAAGEDSLAAADISAALAGLDADSKEAYLVDLRATLEELRAGLAPAADDPV
jgi:transcriptional regulator with XRE-family HTH domain/tetratricopeptide (TPR) repeat protein